MTVFPYLFITAFSKDPFGGNPAVVLFSDLTLPDEIYKGIAINLKQPMAAFVAPEGRISPESPNVASFDIRYFPGMGGEAWLCGHATLAAAKAIFADEGRVPPQVDTIEFRSLASQKVLRATRFGADMIEIRLPACIPQEVSQEQKTRLMPFIHQAFGREVDILHIAEGTGSYGIYVMIEIKEDDLKNSVVNAEPLRGTDYTAHVITAASSSGKEVFLSRMFDPEYIIGGEDMVCGTGHCLIGPYWYRKCGITAGQEVKARQVSSRGGELNLVWLESENVMALRGSLTILGRGELYA
ncbi:hypothetical protein AMATHDRAFT_70292 [Amanita thiersii Skay4041]|uniref:Uncharacterized protein n=1 Tax=Amanita thiersii Skay4041 TaxID=703135 RepID=A0A2A9NA90_9AGAR|nr:hypothetical protein AMATHDRAFT_70292 [Amanita thiersii Skay4041]